MQNSLKYAKVLVDAGLSREVAEAHIQILTEVVGGEMATKSDILELKQNINHLDQKITYELQNLEHRMTLKLGGLMAAFLATGLTAAKLLFI